MDLISNASIPYVDTARMVEIDHAMMEDYQIGLIQMMENAGHHLAHLARRRFLSGDPIGKRIAVMAGSGGNGGGALVAARHLHNWGARVHVCLGKPVESLKPVTRHQLDILQRMNIGGVTSVARNAGLDACFELILDGLIGYSLRGAPQGSIAGLIHWANHRDAPIVSLDMPSGIDATSGTVHDPAIHAAATLTLALPKTGLRQSSAKEVAGELYLADIGVPPELYSRLGITLDADPLFASHDLIRLW